MTRLSILSLGLGSAVVAVDAAKMLSPAAFKALRHQRKQSPRRKLEEAEEEDDISFIGSYNILYQNCFSNTRQVTFKLCPDDDVHRQCDQTDCETGGEYMVDMDEFLDAFLEAQLDAIEYRCEMARENCQNVNDDAISDCYVAQGSFKNYEAYSKTCEDEDKDGNDEEEEEFELQEYLQCKAFDDDYYIGPICSDSVNIHLGLFTDEDCMYLADTTPEELGYNNIQYTAATGNSIITDECASCREHALDQDQNGGDDNDDEDKVVQQCEKLYEESYKCETGYMTSDYHTADDSSCNMINGLKTEQVDFQPRGRTNNTATVIFSALAVVVGVAAVAMIVMHKKKKASAEASKPLM